MAVDLRSWFANELAVDVPVLKLLGGTTVADLVEDVLGGLPDELIPNIKPKESQPDNLPAANAPIDGKQNEKVHTDSGDSLADGTGSVSSPALNTHSSAISTPTDSNNPVSLDPNLYEASKKFQKVVRIAYGSAQFWFLMQCLDNPCVFNTQFRMTLSGIVHVSRLERAVEELGRRHEALRTAFFADPNRRMNPCKESSHHPD